MLVFLLVGFGLYVNKTTILKKLWTDFHET